MKAHIKGSDDFTVSACTIAKNEEKTIVRSINSYKKYVDEIIVVDTGSTDNTVKAAEESGAKVLHFDWCDDFAAAKNAALDVASGDWIVFLDADEFFADDTAKRLRKTIKIANSSGKNAIGCRYEDIDVNKGNSVISEGYLIRVLKRGVKYKFPIHEEPYFPDGINVLSADKSYFYFKHTGYSNKVTTEKSKRNLKILLNEFETEKDDRRKTVICSYISDCYYGLKDYAKCREYAEKFIEESKEKDITMLGCEVKPYTNIINCLESQKADPEKIEPYISEFEQRYPESAEAKYADARNLMREYRFNEALKKCGEAIEVSDKGGTTLIDTVSSHKADVYYNCGKCEEALLHTTNAMSWYFKAFEEDCGHSAALFCLLNIVRKMPQNEIDSFVEPLYMGAPSKKYFTVLSALMCNYMVPQLIKCYASYRSENKEKLNIDITAFIMAGEGKYDNAAKLFYLSNKGNKNDSMAMRSLLFAKLSNDSELIEKSLEICGKSEAFALCLTEKPELDNADINKISTVYIECERVGELDFAKEIMSKVLPNLNNKQLLSLAKLLMESFAAETGLYAAQQADICAESLFMQGYCLYRMRRFNEATELLLLAKNMGYNKPGFDEIYSNITVLREKDSGLPSEEVRKLRKRIGKELESGDFGSARNDITTYLRVAEPDTELLSADATILYYIGEYKRAAVAAECGLLKDEDNFELLYNAACIYEKLDNKSRSKMMYKRALNFCSDENLANEIRQTLRNIA